MCLIRIEKSFPVAAVNIHKVSADTILGGFGIEKLCSGVIGTWRVKEFPGGNKLGGDLSQARFVPHGDQMPRDDEQERSHGNCHIG